MSINGGMDKEVVIQIYSRVLLSHDKAEIESFVEMWMDLDTVIQTEVSQKEKKIPFINVYMWNLKKRYK